MKRSAAASLLSTVLAVLPGGWAAAESPASWAARLHNAAGEAVAGAIVELRLSVAGQVRSATSKEDGAFEFVDLAAGAWSVSVQWQGRTARAAVSLEIGAGARLKQRLELTSDGSLLLHPAPPEEDAGSGEGESLSSRDVSGLPLNKRDFGQLLLLAAGTKTDTNGAANFTQQFAVNGQRGTSAVFAMDGIDTTDPEMGGATFPNFNVDAIQEIRSQSGVMPAEIGRGAAGFTEVITKSGASQIHGTVFEFVRNAAFDARNFFDRRSLAQPGRIPPFARNEFGLTNGGPLFLPRLYDGRNRTFYFAQYQGFRQVLGTTQVLPVPTVEERQGKNTTAFAGDTLFVPVSPKIALVLARYPLPNDPQGPYGARTYATSSKVSVVSDQLSVRIDYRISEKASLFGRFNLNNVDGPTTNPSQTAIDPSFAIRFLDRQRNAGLVYSRAASPRLAWDLSLGFLRTTPLFPTINRTQPALKFADGLYESFNAPGGTVTGAYGNLFQLRHNLSYVRDRHVFKMGAEVRLNRDSTVFGISPNGEYTFGGGQAYSPVEIRSSSGLHDVHAGDPLPDALSGFLTATPFSYTTSVAPPMFAQGDRIGLSAIHRESYNFYFQDSWKLTPSVLLNCGVRYEVNSRIHESAKRTSGAYPVKLDGRSSGARQAFLVNPQPPYGKDWSGWAPRLALEWRPSSRTLLRAAGAITTRLPNLFETNFLTGGTPFVVSPYITAAPGSPVHFENAVLQFNLPPALTPDGTPVFSTGRSTDVAPNAEMDLERFERDLAAGTPGDQLHLLTVFGISPDFRNGYMANYTAGLEQGLGDLDFSAAYVVTIGVKLPAMAFPNGYGGAGPAFAPFTRFDDNGRVLGGFGPEYIMTSRSHSTYHAFQTGLQKTSPRAGLGFQINYTFSKSLDDTSAVLGGFLSASSGAILQTFPQNPRNTRAEKGPSTFDVTHVVAISLVQELPSAGGFWRPLTSGWQIFSLTTLASGSPFSVYSGIQQTDAGASGADRPDQVARPVLSTGRKIREDYFGRGADNASFFSIPIGVPGGSGPNRGRFGTLGRNTFRGPAMRQIDLAVVKDTRLGRRGNAEMLTLQFRAEFFNVPNLVNFGLPANIVLGPGFGIINRTAGTSRQIQFSVKLLY